MFLREPPPSEERDAAYQADLEEDGYVCNHTRLWWAVLSRRRPSQLEDSYCR